jgi:hypothetical protein
MFPYYFNPQNAVSLQCMLVVFPNDFLSESIYATLPQLNRMAGKFFYYTAKNKFWALEIFLFHLPRSEIGYIGFRYPVGPAWPRVLLKFLLVKLLDLIWHDLSQSLNV